MLELRKTLDARIHNNLAARLGNLGYHVEAAPSGFGLREVPAVAVDLFSERAKQVEAVLALLKRGYTPEQFKAVFKGVGEDEKRSILAQGVEKLRERLGAPQSRPSLQADYKIHEQAVMLNFGGNSLNTLPLTSSLRGSAFSTSAMARKSDGAGGGRGQRGRSPARSRAHSPIPKPPRCRRHGGANVGQLEGHRVR
jgi:hypothetical protein